MREIKDNSDKRETSEEWHKERMEKQNRFISFSFRSSRLSESRRRCGASRNEGNRERNYLDRCILRNLTVMIEETAVLPMERFADDIIEEGCVEVLEGGLERRESDTLGIEMVNCRF